MITFNDLRINDDKDELYIDCMIDAGHETEDIWIRSIQLIYYNNILADGTIIDEKKIVEVYEYEDAEEGEPEPEKKTYFAGTVTANDLAPMKEDLKELTFDKGLFYVIVTCDGEDAPANYQDFVVVPDWEFIYSVGMPLISQLAAYGVNRCDAPSRFEEFAIIWYALQLAFATCEFSIVEQLWNRFLRFSNSGSSVYGGCPCNQ